MVWSIVTAVGLIIGGLASLIIGLIPGILEAIRESAEEVGEAGKFVIMLYQGSLIGSAILLFILAAIAIVCAVFCYKAKDKENQSLYILAIVLGVFTGNEVAIIAGVIGLIDYSNSNAKKDDEPTITRIE